MTLRGGIELGDYIRSLPWRFRLRIWLKRFTVRRMLRNGWRPKVTELTYCDGCRRFSKGDVCPHCPQDSGRGEP